MELSQSASINWPEYYKPANSPVHVRNELSISAKPDEIWAWLIRARNWPAWYKNSADVKLLNNTSMDLCLNTQFEWRTFGIPLTSKVLEFIPGERIAWDGHAHGVDVYHAWLIQPTRDGCHVITEETQHGWLARISHRLMPMRMSHHHQIWLEVLRDKAAIGPPPDAVGSINHSDSEEEFI